MVTALRQRLRRLSLVLVSLTVILGGTAVTMQTASASGECGSSYSRIGSSPLVFWSQGGWVRSGTIEIYHSYSTDNSCAIARCYGGWCGHSYYRVVAIKPANKASWVTRDRGMFSYYAGPVYAYDPTVCVDVYAQVALNSSASRVGEFGERYVNNLGC